MLPSGLPSFVLAKGCGCFYFMRVRLRIGWGEGHIRAGKLLLGHHEDVPMISNKAIHG